ncbi:MAG: acetyltransferase [Gallionellaceae bacterium]|nr:MAG: acetyltransferase [Gallionellaceae bacterium]
MSTLLIVGAGGHGKVVADTALETSRWDEILFLDDAWPEKKQNGYWDIRGKAIQLENWKAQCTDAIVAIGNNHLRMELQSKLVSAGFEIATIVHPSARVSRFAKLGAGSVVFANAVINVDAEIGEAAIINTAATVDHDCRLGNGVHVAPGGNLGGGVTVGDFSWIGIGAAIRHYIMIGADVTVGAGAVVVSNVLDGVTAVGSPARPINK